MLRTRAIPIHDDEPEDWQRFLYKATRGSIKAPEIVTYANMAYMVAFTGDPECPDTMPVEAYNALLRATFPSRAPVLSIQQFHDLALDANWIARPFRVSESPRNAPSHYRAIWGRPPVDSTALMNDAMLFCLENWSADHMIKCTDHYGTDYDARMVTAAMLYLSLTWPDG